MTNALICCYRIHLHICRDIEPFLTFFQSKKPVGVFLFSKLKDLLISLLERIVRPNIMDDDKSAYKLLKLIKDISKKDPVTKERIPSAHLLPLESINVGFGAKANLRQLTTTEKSQERHFRLNVQNFVIILLGKIALSVPSL